MIANVIGARMRLANGLPLSVSRASNVLIAAIFGGGAIVVGLSTPVSHDEFQYVASAHLFRSERIYGDFFFSQTPYFPAVLSYWFALTDFVFESRMVAARVLNIICSLTFLASLFYLLVKLCPSRLLAVAIVACVLQTDFMDVPPTTARNDMMPLALTTIALLLIVQSYLARVSDMRRMAAHAAAGLLISIAVCTKQSYAFVAVAVTLCSFVTPHLAWRERWRAQVLPLAAGGLVGAVPALILIVPHWENFLYSTSEFHRTMHHLAETRNAEEYDELSSLAFRAHYLMQRLTHAPLEALTLAFVAFIGVAAYGSRRIRPADLPLVGVLLLAGTNVVLGTALCLVAKPLWMQYVAPIMPFVACCVAAAAALAWSRLPHQLSRWGEWGIRGVALALLATALVAGLSLPSRGGIGNLRETLAGERPWIHEHAGRIRERFRQVLGEERADLPIATLMPIYPIEAGFTTYTEFAGSPFFYRTNDFLHADKVQQLRGVRPAEKSEWLSRNRVRVVLLGLDDALEEPMRSYARENGFLCFTIDMRGVDSYYYASESGPLLVAPELARAEPDCEIVEPGPPFRHLLPSPETGTRPTRERLWR